MRIFRYLLLLFGCLLFYPLTASADCSYERQAELSKIASNVQFSYTYEIQEDLPIYTVQITNLTNDVYVKDDRGNQFYTGPESDKQYPSSTKTIVYTIYSKDNMCRDEVIMKKYVNLPYFNAYVFTDECKNNPDYQYCGMWVDTFNVSFGDFERGLKEYKIDQENKQKETLSKKNFFDKTIEFLKKHYLIVLIALTLIIIISIIIYRKMRVVR